MRRRTFLVRSTAGCMGLASGLSSANMPQSASASIVTGKSNHLEQNKNMEYLDESRKVPVVKEVDVVVIGGGISGMIAAIAAGKMGVTTIVVDRFGRLGGNIGPGYHVGGSAYSQTSVALQSDLPSVAQEFFERIRQQITDSGYRSDINQQNYAELSHLISYHGASMAEEAGVELIFSVYGCDPIVEDNVVKGIFLEGKSGRVAIKSKILIDATGDANIAERAGARIIRYVSEDFHFYNESPPSDKPDAFLFDECGLYMYIGNANRKVFDDYLRENEDTSDDDHTWAQEHLVGRNKYHGVPNAMIPLLRKAHVEGYHYYPIRELKEKTGLDITISNHWGHMDWTWCGENIVQSRAAIATGEIDVGNMDVISLLEKELRTQAFEKVEFLKKYAPGFSNDSYILFTSPYLGSRGGPFIEGEHTLTLQDWAGNRRFDDVIFQSFRTRSAVLDYAGEDWEPGLDVPYRMMLPKGFDNIYVVARGAAYVQRGHDGIGQMRTRPILMTLGQAGGTAAAMCVKTGASAQTLDIKTLQNELLKQGFNLGDTERLRELDLNV